MQSSYCVGLLQKRCYTVQTLCICKYAPLTVIGANQLNSCEVPWSKDHMFQREPHIYFDSISLFTDQKKSIANQSCLKRSELNWLPWWPELKEVRVNYWSLIWRVSFWSRPCENLHPDELTHQMHNTNKIQFPQNDSHPRRVKLSCCLTRETTTISHSHTRGMLLHKVEGISIENSTM